MMDMHEFKECKHIIHPKQYFILNLFIDFSSLDDLHKMKNSLSDRIHKLTDYRYSVQERSRKPVLFTL